jgi:tRNA pseudouridine38-40 synthase
MSTGDTRYFIFLSFKGTSYHGWQLQPNAITVQKILDDSLSTILGETILCTGAGRTDTGVHASFYCAHFDTLASDLSGNRNFVFKLNRFLPKDISIAAVKKVIPDAHARFSAVSRTYKYYITRKKDPFREESAWALHGNLDVALMNEACRVLMEYDDFTSFCRLHSDNKTNICRIFSASWAEEDDILLFTIRADRFLRNMVRAIVGTMVELAQGKMTPEEFREIISAKDRCRAGKSAPAKALFLSAIEYPDEIFI